MQHIALCCNPGGGIVAGRIANMKVGDNQYKSGSANLHTLISQPQAAEMVNVSFAARYGRVTLSNRYDYLKDYLPI